MIAALFFVVLCVCAGYPASANGAAREASSTSFAGFARLGYGDAGAAAAGETGRLGYVGADEDSIAVGRGTANMTKPELKEELARLGASEIEGTREWERKKSPTVAMLSSMALPGLGQLYNGRRYKTILAAGFFTFYMGYAWLEAKQADVRETARDQYPVGSLEWRQENLFYEFHRDNARTFLWWAGAVWLISALDAYVDAHLYDVRNVTPTAFRGADDVNYLALSFDF
jgi:hypothetical protein